MTPDTIASLINLGSAGVVIIVVIIFLNFITKRDEEWRSFFTLLNANSKDDMRAFANTMDRLVTRVDSIGTELDNHDAHVDERVKLITGAARTQPRTR
jgi:hypothetical protein